MWTSNLWRIWNRPLQRLLFQPTIIALVIMSVWAGYHVVITRLWKVCITQQTSYKHLCGNSPGVTQGDMVFSNLPSKLPELKQGYDIEFNESLPGMRGNSDNDHLTVAHDGGGGDDYDDDEVDVRKSSMVAPKTLTDKDGEDNKPVILGTPPTKMHVLVTSEEKRVAKLMEGFRKSAGVLSRTFMKNTSSCRGKRVFIHKLPTKFNEDLVKQCEGILPWLNMCDFMPNSGMGQVDYASSSHESSKEVLVPPGVWYRTNQHMLEVVFHERLKHYPCLVHNPELGDLFYIPYYGGLDVLRWHYAENASDAQKDALGLELLRWLKEQPAWTRTGGVDHVLVLGRISWDFRRLPTVDWHWGSSLLVQDEMQNLTKLLIERDPSHENDIGVPHPTFFHPRHDKDIKTWQAHIESAKRRHFVGFAGAPRPHQRESIRSVLIEQCLGSINGSCFFLHCGERTCFKPSTTMGLFLQSEFCLQPPGDSATRRSIFDSLIGGCIPVLFDPKSAYFQYPWHLPADASMYSVYLPAKDVLEGKTNVVDELRKIPKRERDTKRKRIIRDIMPGLVYAMPGTKLEEVEDAFDISLRSLLSRASFRQLEKELLQGKKPY